MVHGDIPRKLPWIDILKLATLPPHIFEVMVRSPVQPVAMYSQWRIAYSWRILQKWTEGYQYKSRGKRCYIGQESVRHLYIAYQDGNRIIPMIKPRVQRWILRTGGLHKSWYCSNCAFKAFHNSNHIISLPKGQVPLPPTHPYPGIVA